MKIFSNPHLDKIHSALTDYKSFLKFKFYFSIELSGEDDEFQYGDKDYIPIPIIEVSGILFREARIHPHELDFGEFDQQGNFLVMGGSEFGKIFLCDTQTSKSGGMGPPSMIGGGHNTRKKGTFKPSFGSPNEEKVAVEESLPTDDEDDKKYFKVCHYVRFEGQMLDLSFVNKTLIALTSTPSEDVVGATNESEQVRFSGNFIIN